MKKAPCDYCNLDRCNAKQYEKCAEYERIEKKHKLSEGQIQNLEDDGFFDDLRAEKDRLGAEIYFED